MTADASGGTAGNEADRSGAGAGESDPTSTSKAGRGGSASGSGGRGFGGASAHGGSADGGTTSAGAAGEAGAGASELCTPGTMRCNTVREHCDDSGVWVEESFVCATDITGSVEQGLVCAVKSDGRMTCFGPSFDLYSAPLLAAAPARKWSKLILTDDVGDKTDHDLCGIDKNGGGVCWGQTSNRSVGGPLTQIAPGSQGLCVVSADGALKCLVDDGIVGPIAADSGPFQDLLIRDGYLFGLGVSGTVSVPYPQFALPSGVYSQISGSDRELCAVRLDHELFCAPTALPPALAAQRFLQVVIDDGGRLCAIREDHTVVCDSLGAGPNPEPPSGEFKQLVMPSGGICGIRTDGSIGCVGVNAPVPPADW